MCLNRRGAAVRHWHMEGCLAAAAQRQAPGGLALRDAS